MVNLGACFRDLANRYLPYEITIRKKARTRNVEGDDKSEQTVEQRLENQVRQYDHD